MIPLLLRPSTSFLFFKSAFKKYRDLFLGFFNDLYRVSCPESKATSKNEGLRLAVDGPDKKAYIHSDRCYSEFISSSILPRHMLDSIMSQFARTAPEGFTRVELKKSRPINNSRNLIYMERR